MEIESPNQEKFKVNSCLPVGGEDKKNAKKYCGQKQNTDTNFPNLLIIKLTHEPSAMNNQQSTLGTLIFSSL